MNRRQRKKRAKALLAQVQQIGQLLNWLGVRQWYPEHVRDLMRGRVDVLAKKIRALKAGASRGQA